MILYHGTNVDFGEIYVCSFLQSELLTAKISYYSDSYVLKN